MAEQEKNFVKDYELINSVKLGNITPQNIESWMSAYGLFQGVKKEDRIKVSKIVTRYFLDFINNDNQFALEEQFKSLHEKLSEGIDKKWLSATTKLLWVMEPNNTIIYDSLVAKSITVLQCLDNNLARLPRINLQPKYHTKKDIFALYKYYNNYQIAVRAIYDQNIDIIQKAKEELNSQYNYDIRLIDKLLWRMGDSNAEFELDGIKCELVKFA